MYVMSQWPGLMRDCARAACPDNLCMQLYDWMDDTSRKSGSSCIYLAMLIRFYFYLF